MYVVGTAGHVDHGKSTLVKTLTGIDPDRWEEEQRREMTIDLGFAWLVLPSGRPVSIIDVPGHERFIKNMLAGIGGIDAALLVVAADESVMPQTEEHLAILDLLEIQHGLVVITKADLVDPEWLALVIEDVRARLQGTSLADIPLVPVSARTGQGLDLLLATLDSQLEHMPSRSMATGTPRLPIDRAFTIGGFGAVVTGTLADGPIRIGDEVEILPRGLRARVRGLQTHQQREELARPGSRVAVNLAGISHHDLARGDVLALPGRLRPTELLDAHLRVVGDAPRAIEQNAPLELFVGATQAPCRVTLLNCDQLAPGEQGWVQIRLERPIAVARGDRYIVRQPSPGQTIGGGRIIDAHPARHRRFRPEVIAGLEALARGTPTDLLARALADNTPHTWAEILKISSLPDYAAIEALAELQEQGSVIELAGSRNPDMPPAQPAWLISMHGWETLCGKLETTLRTYHRRYPLRTGMPREELRSRLKLPGDSFDALVTTAQARGLVKTQVASVRLPEHTPALAPDQQRLTGKVLVSFTATPYSPPALELDPEITNWLVEQGRIVLVAPEIAFLQETYQEMTGWVREQIINAGSVTVAQFRDRFGNSRKYALALLEHLDERKITRRAGDARILY